MYQKYKLGIVIPAYNEEKLIAATIKAMLPAADRLYVIDDASTDRTCQAIESFPDKRICLISHKTNQGVGAAITTGYRQFMQEGLDIAVVMAGDNQMRATYLPDLLRPIIAREADYSKGNRLTRLNHTKGMSKWRLFGNFTLTLLTKIASGYWKIGDPQNGYTAITREALKRIDLDNVYPRYGYPNDMLVKLNVAGCKVVDVPIPAIYGTEKSKIKYSVFITKVSPLLLRGFIWRLKTRYFAHQPAHSLASKPG